MMRPKKSLSIIKPPSSILVEKFFLIAFLMMIVSLFFQRSSAKTIQNNGIFSPLLPSRCPSPPCVCDVDEWQRKVVLCAFTVIKEIPVHKMDPETRVLNITAPVDRYNSLTLGRYFNNLTILEEVHITRSRLPAIGDSTFCPIQNFCSNCHSMIKVLNLSSNVINTLTDRNFVCLESLEVLDLNDNDLSHSIPSAPFVRLKNLTRLLLARNKINQLVPRFFHELSTLIELDLSENPLVSIQFDQLRDLPNLRVLNLQGCQLIQIEANTFNGFVTFKSFLNRLTFFPIKPGLLYLEKLVLSENRLKHLNESAFQSLENLRELRLNKNYLTVLPNRVFSNLDLAWLDLSENLINPLTDNVFDGAKSIRRLEISSNKMTSFTANLLKPLATSLAQLSIDRNQNLIDAPSSLVALLQPLKRLKRLSATELGLDESLPESTFDFLSSINYLNFSGNNFNELNSRLISPLVSLYVLDISRNRLSFIDPSTFQIFSQMKHLAKVYLHDNPFSCYRCRILPFIDWLNTDPQEYFNTCSRLTNDPKRLVYCAQCSSPESLDGRYLHEKSLSDDLEWCTNPEVQLRLTASEPQVGLVLAFLIILSLIAIILVIVTIYRKHGAVYYTQEDKMPSTEKIYQASVGEPIWRHKPADENRLFSFTSTNNSMSRQNTMFSPQSSFEQTSNVPNAANTSIQSPTRRNRSISPEKDDDPTTRIGCNQCAENVGVQRMIAQLPVMTEMLESSLKKQLNNQQHNSNSLASLADCKNNSKQLFSTPLSRNRLEPNPNRPDILEIKFENKPIEETKNKSQMVVEEPQLLEPTKLESSDDGSPKEFQNSGTKDDQNQELVENFKILI